MNQMNSIYNYEPIECQLNLRDGSFGKTLRSRKGLIPTGPVFINPNETLSSLVHQIKVKLPSNFVWDEAAEPIRFQRSKEQPQHRLESLQPGTDIFQFFFGMKMRLLKRSMENVFMINLWIYGDWKIRLPITPPLERTDLVMDDWEASSSLLGLRSQPSLDQSPKYVSVTQHLAKPTQSKFSDLLYTNHNDLEAKKQRLEEDLVTIQVVLNGVAMPMQFKRQDLLRALGLGN